MALGHRPPISAIPTAARAAAVRGHRDRFSSTGRPARHRAKVDQRRELFSSFHQAGTTVVVAAHDETLMADYGHRILRLQQGRLI